MTNFAPAVGGPGFDEARYELADGPGKRLVKRDTRTAAEKARAKFWDKRREETGDPRCGSGIFGDMWDRFWAGQLCELTHRKSGEMTHVRLMRFWPDEGLADLAVVAVMAGGETSGIGLQAKTPWPPKDTDVRVISDSRK